MELCTPGENQSPVFCKPCGQRWGDLAGTQAPVSLPYGATPTLSLRTDLGDRKGKLVLLGHRWAPRSSRRLCPRRVNGKETPSTEILIEKQNVSHAVILLVFVRITTAKTNKNSQQPLLTKQTRSHMRRSCEPVALQPGRALGPPTRGVRSHPALMVPRGLSSRPQPTPGSPAQLTALPGRQGSAPEWPGPGDTHLSSGVSHQPLHPAPSCKVCARPGLAAPKM